MRTLNRLTATPSVHLEDPRRVDLAIDAPIDSNVLAGCDAVIHLAAFIPKDQSDPRQAENCFRVNCLGTLRLLEAAEQAGVSSFIHTGSANADSPKLVRPDREFTDVS